MKVSRIWDCATGIATVEVITNDGETLIGEAKTHPEDQDMSNSYTGFAIAESRVKIKMFTREMAKVRAQLDGLRHLASLYQQAGISIKDKSVKILSSEMNNCKDYYDALKENRETERRDLRMYIQEKDKYYQQIRKNRNKNNKDEG